MPVDSLGKLSLYTGTKQTDSISDEEINEVILRLLGLEDTFDIDYDTYKTLLKQKLIENQILTSKGKAMPSDEIEILQNELKRIRGKVGRFTIRKKKIGVDAFRRGTASDQTQTQTQEAKTTSEARTAPGTGRSAYSGVKPPETEGKKADKKSSTFLDSLRNIRISLGNIFNTLRDQFKEEKKTTEKDRRRRVRSRRTKEEEGLEKKNAKELKKIKDKMLAPVKGILDKIWDFIKFTLLGAIFTKFVRWFSDPKNAKKVEVLGRLLKTFWPALLAAFLLFMTPFGTFVRSTIKLVAFFAKGMAKIMPMLLAALKNLRLTAGGRLTGRGKVAAAAGLFMAGAAIPSLLPGTVDSQERKIKGAPGSKDAKIKKLQEERAKVGWFDPWGKKAEIDEQIHALQTGQTKRYAGGGRIFSGFVGPDTGTTVTGAGQDTQLLPVGGGGSAVLAQGELVLNEEQQQKLAAETGVDPAKFVIGSRPAEVSGKLKPVDNGFGPTQGFSKGGVIGSGQISPQKSSPTKQSGRSPISLLSQLGNLMRGAGKFPGIFTPKKEEQKQEKNPLVDLKWNNFVQNSFKNRNQNFWKSPSKSVQKKQYGGRVKGYAGGGSVAPAQLGAIIGGADPKKINPVYK